DQVVRNIANQGVTVQLSPEALQYGRQERSKLVPPGMNGKLAGIDPQHLHRVSDERLKTVQALVDNGHKFAISGACRSTRPQIARGGLHRREWRLELVGERVQNGRA